MGNMYEEQNNVLETVRRVTGKLSLPSFIKPCIAVMLGESFQDTFRPGERRRSHTVRGEAAFIIASELRRIGHEQEKAEADLFAWNQHNVPPLRTSEIRSAVRSAYRKEHSYGCNHETLLQYCRFEDKQLYCEFYRTLMALNGIRTKTGNDDFYKYRWPRRVKLAGHAVYLALIYLEKRRGLRAGSRIYANQREIMEISGIGCLGTVGKALTKLSKEGLILYVPGTPRKWEGLSGEIQRIIPIPEHRRGTEKVEQGKMEKQNT